MSPPPFGNEDPWRGTKQSPPSGVHGEKPDAQDDLGGPVLPDPFLKPAAAPVTKARLGVAARVLIGSVVFLGSAGIASWLLWSRAAPSSSMTGVGSTEAPSTTGVTLRAPTSVTPSLSPAPSAQGSSPLTQRAPVNAAPSQTVVNRLGAIEIVDLGTHDQKKLYDELADQRALAHANGQTLLLMTTRFGSELFRDFDTALADPRVQAALAGVRLVRAELHYFTPELEELGIPTDSYPWFFLLRGDLVPRDGISGGEWDEDVPQNIAPVLEAFVKGTLTTRRQKWTPPRSNDIQL